ncbi:MAG: helix-turn-helix domain-containing protein [Candidatus Heimdallarchaeum aukensis]|uniref:Helix-turn-helix domain-containing protein n=1 Tax=Candidatus Heimdallarchaeum aukensis TaxID=2876573 RepID=A0A9Y1FLU3_9ARCH|nr:MAG: helix-turn-helix domain-containing protein [Candidatus Heimdallarchaeum aukensis]
MDNSNDSIKEMKLFSNQTRRDLLKLLGESGGLSFTNIKEELRLTDGRLYFHLKKLEGYIEKDTQNNYKLTLDGKKIYDSLFFSHIKEQKKFEEDVSSKSLNKIFPEDIVYYLIGTKTRSMIELNMLLLILCWFFAVTDSYFSSIETIVLGGAIVNFVINLIHWYFYCLLIYIILKIAKKGIDFVELTIVTIIGIAPYFLYLLIKGILQLLNIEIIGLINIVLVILFVICKIWSSLIIAQGLTVVSKIHPSQSLLAVISLTIIDYLYLFITLSM